MQKRILFLLLFFLLFFLPSGLWAAGYSLTEEEGKQVIQELRTALQLIRNLENELSKIRQLLASSEKRIDNLQKKLAISKAKINYLEKQNGERQIMLDKQESSLKEASAELRRQKRKTVITGISAGAGGVLAGIAAGLIISVVH